MAIPFHLGAVVVTSISAPNDVLKSLAQGCAERGAPFIVVGDSKSPNSFELEGCRFLSLAAQKSLPFRYAGLCPECSYSRKNIGYLAAIKGGALFIVETDDDNFPREEFWNDRERTLAVDTVTGSGWVNVYELFADEFIYPRGFPLDQARRPGARPKRGRDRVFSDCAIQQGLADENPDVDAVYRMLFPLPFNFRKDASLMLSEGQWCPFNSQNTTFFKDVFPLLYLPAFCSFRMTDIWRSFVAQRILWSCGLGVLFHSATVWQERNAHDLQRDFDDEVVGYQNNAKIARKLSELKLASGIETIPENMIFCYRTLVEAGWVGEGEITLLEAWLSDIRGL